MADAPRPDFEPSPTARSSTRLFTRLLIGYSVPVLVVSGALALTLVALLRMTSVLETINDTELAALHKESVVHKASWAVEGALREGESACKTRQANGEASASVERGASALRQALLESPAASTGMREVAESWLGVADEVLRGDVCQKLLSREFQERRTRLDDQLTRVWGDRVNELRAGVAHKDELARNIGVTAATAGTVLALGSLLLALFLAQRMAQAVNRPLERLAAIARSVGRGDFSKPVEAGGPAEIASLAEELELMRRQLAQLEIMKQNFLASVSHELRTPLSKIREALALLNDGAVGPLDHRQGRVVQIARVACEREIRMVVTLLDLSRLRAGSPLQLREDVSVDVVIETALGDERDEAASRDIRVTFRTETKVPYFPLDAVLMERAIANLVRNAVSVSKPGQEVLVVRSRATPEGKKGDWVRISVSDEGPGVPKDIRDTVFNAFVTSAVPRSPKAIGIGLGLALAREVAQAHGGDLVLDDTTTTGATFHLWLPLEPRAMQSSDLNPSHVQAEHT